MQRVRWFGLIIFLVILFSTISHAWDLPDKPFGFRLQITDDRGIPSSSESHPMDHDSNSSGHTNSRPDPEPLNRV